MIKKYTFILILLISLTSCGQETFHFESKVNPNKTYYQTISMTSTNKVNYLTENPELKDKTAESNSSMQMTRTLTTKKTNENGQIPSTMEYGKIISISNGNKTENAISGTLVKGFYENNTKFKVHQVVSDQLNEKTKESIKYALENVKPDIDFPKKPLKIGDSFEHSMPMTIPINGANPVKIDLIKIFTLKSVKDNIAVFDLKEKIQLNTEIEQTNVEGKGDGSGIVEFDIKENQIIKDTAKFTYELNVKVNDSLTLNTIMSSSTEKIMEIN